MIHNFFNGAVRHRIQQRAENYGLQGQQAIDLITTTKNTVKEVLQAEMKNGHYNEVLSFLRSAALKTGQQVFFDKIMQRVVLRLIVRFGLPQSIALTLASFLVPFILKRLGKKALKSGKVQDLLNILGVKERLDKLDILKHQVKNKFTSSMKFAD